MPDPTIPQPDQVGEALSSSQLQDSSGAGASAVMPSAATVSIVLVDDHALLRDSVARLLNAEAGLSVVGMVGEAGGAVALCVKFCPDVIVMDIDMPGLSPFEAAKEIGRLCRDTRILFLSSYAHDRYIEQALDAHADGYLTKSESAETVVQAIRTIANGGSHFSEAILDRLIVDHEGARLARPSPSRISTLTPREIETLRYVACGLTKKEIAAIMHVSAKTVEKHSDHLMQKLDIHDRVELTRFAIREGLTEA
ncbi:MAG: response regulator [Phycisphaerae bacterium]